MVHFSAKPKNEPHSLPTRAKRAQRSTVIRFRILCMVSNDYLQIFSKIIVIKFIFLCDLLFSLTSEGRNF
ncbi:MAG: hypothetical protein U5L45_04535 [Saprospiraceae bacterium]|nr:hypothetical protein [Saprospiraceae bacterium]